MKAEIPQIHKLLETVPESEKPRNEADFWRYVALELRTMITMAYTAREPEIVLTPMRQAGSQFIWEFWLNDLAIPKEDKFNLHFQNTSQWKYAGCILLEGGNVSTHH